MRGLGIDVRGEPGPGLFAGRDAGGRRARLNGRRGQADGAAEHLDRRESREGDHRLLLMVSKAAGAPRRSKMAGCHVTACRLSCATFDSPCAEDRFRRVRSALASRDSLESVGLRETDYVRPRLPSPWARSVVAS